MVSIHKPILKNPCKDMKHCALCKKHGGLHTTHNMSDCRKCNKDRKIKKIFGKGQHGSMASDKKTASAFVQLLVQVAKLEKATKKLKKSLHKCKCNYDSDSDDSDSS